MVEMERTEWSDLRQEHSNKIEAPGVSEPVSCNGVRKRIIQVVANSE